MVFTTVVFFLFAAIYFALAPLFARTKNPRLAYITIMSLVFYGWGNPWWILLLLLSGGVDFAAALAMGRWSRWSNALLIVSLSANLGILGLFKYSSFALGNLDALMANLGIPLHAQANLPNWALILPVGISFYTFQSMSYTIDVWRGRLAAIRNPLTFFAYLSLFPQLVAGPIVRATDLVHLVENPAPCPARKRMTGLWLVVTGFFQKAVIADNLAPYVDAAFTSPQPAADAIYWWWIALLFACQIYCDFSGYTRIARGLGVWMGMRFPANFRHPYVASSFRDFWTRWHISLSSWFRDYVYIPLGGAHVPAWRAHLNLWITMLLSGLWHGAAWHFVAWGAAHAGLLSVERLTHWPQKLGQFRGGVAASIAIVFVCTLLTWIVFRSTDLTQMLAILGIMVGLGHAFVDWTHPNFGFVPICLVAYVLSAEFMSTLPRERVVRRAILRRPWLEAGVLAGVVMITICCRGQGQQFIYFQF